MITLRVYFGKVKPKAKTRTYLIKPWLGGPTVTTQPSNALAAA
jgi:hypothetical protein